MPPDLQRWWCQSHWLDLHQIEADLTIWTEQTPEQKGKDKQRRTKTANKTKSHYDDENTEEKPNLGSKIDPKPPLFGGWRIGN